jgi:hypothetical protein
LSPPKPQIDRRLISDAGARAMAGRISAMTRRRWQDRAEVGWPKVICVVAGRNYYYLAEIEALIDRLIAATARGESVIVAPPKCSEIEELTIGAP